MFDLFIDDDVAKEIIDDAEKRHVKGLAIIQHEFSHREFNVWPILGTRDISCLSHNSLSPVPNVANHDGSVTYLAEEALLNLTCDRFLKGPLIGPKDPTNLFNLIGPFDPKDLDDVTLIESTLSSLIHCSRFFF